VAAPVLVDTSVWVEALRPAGRTLSALAALLRGAVRAVTSGVVIQEVLQGVRAPRDVARVSNLLRALPYLTVTRDTHLRAAALHRRLRGVGVTTHTVDVLLAQLPSITGRPCGPSTRTSRTSPPSPGCACTAPSVMMIDEVSMRQPARLVVVLLVMAACGDDGQGSLDGPAAGGVGYSRRVSSQRLRYKAANAFSSSVACWKALSYSLPIQA